MNSLDISNFEFDEVTIESPKSAVQDKSNCSVRFGIIGAGQCGGRLAAAFNAHGYAKNIYINTTTQDVTEGVPYSLIINIKNKVTGGAGKYPEVSAAALEANKSRVFALMAEVFKTVDHIIVCAGLGGGTGNGTVVPLINIAKAYMSSIGYDDNNNRVSAIVTLPSRSEMSATRIRNNTAQALREIDALVQANEIGFVGMIDNERAMGMYNNTMNTFYHKINHGFIQQFDVFNQLSAQNSNHVSLDMADFRDIIQTSGYMLIGSSIVELKTDSITTAMVECLAKTPTVNPDDFDLGSAKKAGAIFAADRNILNTKENLMQSLEQGYGALMERVHNSVLHRGIYEISVDKDGRRGRVFVIVTGLTRPNTKFSKIGV